MKIVVSIGHRQTDPRTVAMLGGEGHLMTNTYVVEGYTDLNEVLAEAKARFPDATIIELCVWVKDIVVAKLTGIEDCLDDDDDEPEV